MTPPEYFCPCPTILFYFKTNLTNVFFLIYVYLYKTGSCMCLCLYPTNFFTLLNIFKNFRACFIFRNPGTLKPGAEVLKPFSVKTWYATIGYAVIMGLAIKVAYWMEYKFLKSRVNYSLFTSIVITISALAQQGLSQLFI